MRAGNTRLFVLAAMLAATAVLASCARRPALTQASTPAPTGAGGVTAPAAPGTPSAPAPPASPQVGAAARPDTSPQPSAAPAPAPATPPSPREFAAVPELADIRFDFDKYNIRSRDAAILDKNAAWLKSNPSTLVLIEGHCD